MQPSELIDAIFANPSISLGYPSITRMEYFIAGYISALIDLNSYREDPLYNGFSEWICQKYLINEPHSWASVLSFKSVSEEHAFAIGKKLWAEYKSETLRNHSESK